MVTEAQQKALADRFPDLFTFSRGQLLPGFRWKESRLYADLESLDTINKIELAMSVTDRDWFKTELWRAVTSHMPKPLDPVSHAEAVRSMYSAGAVDRLAAILKTLRIA